MCENNNAAWGDVLFMLQILVPFSDSQAGSKNIYKNLDLPELTAWHLLSNTTFNLLGRLLRDWSCILNCLLHTTDKRSMYYIVHTAFHTVVQCIMKLLNQFNLQYARPGLVSFWVWTGMSLCSKKREVLNVGFHDFPKDEHLPERCMKC